MERLLDCRRAAGTPKKDVAKANVAPDFDQRRDWQRVRLRSKARNQQRRYRRDQSRCAQAFMNAVAPAASAPGW